MRNFSHDWRKGLYRSRGGALLGVCRGLADYWEWPVWVVRMMFIMGTMLLFPWPIVAYFVLAIVMKPEPVRPFDSETDREFYDSYAASRTMAIHRLKRSFDNLDQRIRRMETVVTSRDFDWDKRLQER